MTVAETKRELGRGGCEGREGEGEGERKGREKERKRKGREGERLPQQHRVNLCVMVATSRRGR